MALLNNRADICVCEITAIIGLSQPAVSSHLRVLEESGLIRHRKDGLWVNYSISGGLGDNIRAILDGALGEIGKSRQIKDDLRRLFRTTREKICSDRKPI